jgi:hypothetical protein
VAEYQWSSQFQRKIISLMIKDPVRTMDLVQPEYFTDPMRVDISRIVKEIYGHHKKGEVELSKSTLLVITKAWLGRKRRNIWPAYRQEIRKIFQEPESEDVIILNQVIDFARDMKFKEALVSGEKDVSARRYDQAIKRFMDLRDFGKENPDDLGVEYKAGLNDLSRWKEDRSNIVPTMYFPSIDRAIGGGLAAGELAIILANPKVGKSMLLGAIAAGAMWRNKIVAIATGEISAKRYRRRIDSLMSGVPSRDLAKRKYRKRARRRLRIAFRQAKGKLFIKQFATGRARIADVDEWLDALEREGHKVDVLLLDYLYLFRPNFSVKERRLNIGQTAIDLRGLAVARDIPVWTASQGNRAALEKEVLTPKDFAEDISQFWVLDFMFALCQSKAEYEATPERARLLMPYARDFRGRLECKVKINREIYSIAQDKRGE